LCNLMIHKIHNLIWNLNYVLLACRLQLQIYCCCMGLDDLQTNLKWLFPISNVTFNFFVFFFFQSLFFFYFDIVNVLMFWLFMFVTNSTSSMCLQILKIRFKTMFDDQTSQITNSHLFFINNKLSISSSSNVKV
jgi:hypothetical protein